MTAENYPVVVYLKGKRVHTHYHQTPGGALQCARHINKGGSGELRAKHPGVAANPRDGRKVQDR